MRIASFNLLYDVRGRATRLESAARALRALAPDIVALQEVSSGWLRPGDPAARLAEALHLAHFARHWLETNGGVFRNGLAVLSRYPLHGSLGRSLRASGFWNPRGYLGVTAETPLGRLDLVCVHLRSTGREHVKRRELDELGGELAARARRSTVVAAGDFNWDWAHPLFREFRGRLGAADLASFVTDDAAATWLAPSGETQRRIDDILIVPGPRGAQARMAGGGIASFRSHPEPSDHHAVYADLAAPSHAAS